MVVLIETLQAILWVLCFSISPFLFTVWLCIRCKCCKCTYMSNFLFDKCHDDGKKNESFDPILCDRCSGLKPQCALDDDQHRGLAGETIDKCSSMELQSYRHDSTLE